jgi:cytochrome P450
MFNPFDPGFAASPYEQYAAIRAAGRTRRSLMGILVAAHYDDCFSLLRQPGTSVDERNVKPELRPAMPVELQERRDDERRSILTLDPPDHTRLRRLVSSAFTVRRIEQLRPRVRELVDGLLTDVAAEEAATGGPVDLIAGFAFPLPFVVISELLGMPEADRIELRSWSQQMTRTLEPIIDEDTLSRALDAADHMVAHLADAIEWKRHNPADDLLSALIAAEEDGDRLTADELEQQLLLLYVAGHETTVNLIGNGTMALLRNRDQFELLRTTPEIDTAAVDELLRYDSPVQVSRRIVMTEMEVGGEMVEPGEIVITLLGSANRDEDHWGPTAGRLDLTREGASGHLSFGSGIHHCLGSALARLEASEAVPALVRRFPEMELATDEPAWNGRIVLRGLDNLPVALTPSGSG